MKQSCTIYKNSGVGVDAEPHLQTECLYDWFDAILVEGAEFLKASLHGLQRKRGGWVGGGGGRSPPPLANTTFFFDRS